SDEMLPIFLSEAAPISLIWKSLVIKMVIGIIAGLIIDIFVRRRAVWKEMKRKGDPRKNNPFQIKELCEQEQCHCGPSHMWQSALTHTVQVFLFILLISLALNVVIELVGTETLKGFILNDPVWGAFLAGIIGLIPNCAASVVLTELYLEGAMGFGALMAGLLVGAGVGLLVLARVNRHVKENLKIIGLLYVIGVGCGVLLGLIGVTV
nr:arsenic efflux protein [Lachnospiraceae bacterium]